MRAPVTLQDVATGLARDVRSNPRIGVRVSAEQCDQQKCALHLVGETQSRVVSSFAAAANARASGLDPEAGHRQLPVTGAELFGAIDELELLDEAWASETTNVVSLVAWGGVGKSTLVNKWLEALEADNWRGAQRVLGWSFFSQGTGERATSADQFIDHALSLLRRSRDLKAGSPWAKGERLAELARKNRALLILDSAGAATRPAIRGSRIRL